MFRLVKLASVSTTLQKNRRRFDWHWTFQREKQNSARVLLDVMTA